MFTITYFPAPNEPHNIWGLWGTATTQKQAVFDAYDCGGTKVKVRDSKDRLVFHRVGNTVHVDEIGYKEWRSTIK